MVGGEARESEQPDFTNLGVQVCLPTIKCPVASEIEFLTFFFLEILYPLPFPSQPRAIIVCLTVTLVPSLCNSAHIPLSTLPLLIALGISSC